MTSSKKDALASLAVGVIVLSAILVAMTVRAVDPNAPLCTLPPEESTDTPTIVARGLLTPVLPLGALIDRFIDSQHLALSQAFALMTLLMVVPVYAAPCWILLRLIRQFRSHTTYEGKKA
jgi:hypothetical protein